MPWRLRTYGTSVLTVLILTVWPTSGPLSSAIPSILTHAAGKERRGENEAVAGLGLDPGLAVIGALRR